MAKVNNMLLVLTILLLIISLLGTFSLLSKVSFERPGGGPSGVKHGEVKITVLPETEVTDGSATGYVTLTVEP
jgi:hypothetical protein